MAYQKTYQRPDGSRVKVEPVLEIDSFDSEAISYAMLHLARRISRM